MKKQDKSSFGIHGLHKITICVPESNIAKEIEKMLEEAGKMAWDKYMYLMKELRIHSEFREKVVENIIPTAGRTVIAQWIVGDNTNDADNGANYGSLGTDNTTPANGDTTLGTETYRKATSSGNNSSNVALLSNFYSAAEVTGTFEEAGWHIDGTASADTGQLLSHFLIGTTVKSAAETLTVESTLTIS